MLLPSGDHAREVLALLDRVGIGDKIYHRTDTLSGGKQQRVAIARALYQKPAALLADEPVSAVDPARARDTVALLSQISEEENLTLVMSLHNLELAREFFPRLAGLRQGAIAFDQNAADLGDDAFHQLYALSDAEMLED
ncbi:MAG: ATP-binding cassette domain-containing protein [Verrucomicrobiales bacterium]